MAKGFSDWRQFRRKLAGFKHLAWNLAISTCCLWTSVQAAPEPFLGARLDPKQDITQLLHDSWGLKEGLPSQTVNAIAQTPDGYLWVGTMDGLVRFDGVRFTPFRSSNYPGIGSDEIVALFVDRTGDLWISTNGGGLTRYKDGIFTRFTTQDGLAHNRVYKVSQARDGALWIGTVGGATRLKNGVFTIYRPDKSLLGKAFGEHVFSIMEDRTGALWMATLGRGLRRYKNRVWKIFGIADGLGTDRIINLLENNDGTMLISTFGNGLLRYDNGIFSRYLAANGPGEDRLTQLTPDASGALWIGTNDHGVTRLYNGRFSNYSKEQGLSDITVNQIFEDREGNLWIGTNGGLDRLRTGKFRTYSTEQGLSHNRAWAIYGDPDDTLWVATEGGGLNRLQQGRFKAFTAKDGLASNNTSTVFRDRGGSLWIGTFEAGVSKFRDGAFTTYGPNQGVRGLVTSIIDADGGGIWIGSYNGLGRLRDGKFTLLENQPGFVNQTINTLLRSRNGDLWIGTFNSGLMRLRNGKFATYTVESGLASNYVSSLYEDAENTLWIGTKDGLTRYKDGRFFSFNRPGGFTDAEVGGILERDGELWISTPNQLFCVAKKEFGAMADGRAQAMTAISYGRDAGVTDLSTGLRSTGWKTKDGRLWFASSKLGVISVDPPTIPVNRIPPAVLIEQLTVGDNKIDASVPRNRLKFAPGQGTLEFQYTALSFAVPEKIKFKYKLHGFDPDWVDAGTRRTAFYTNLPPGNFRFQVIASNNDGVWNERGASFEFELKPFYYQTWWFYALCATLLAAIAIGWHGIRMRILRIRANELSDTVNQRTYELASRTNELASANEALEKMARLDSLTGIYNRRTFDERFREEWQRALRQEMPLSVAMIDIDEFKLYNDTYGHQQGDECLLRVAEELQKSIVRSGDLLARYGGEEFVVLLPSTDGYGAFEVAERLRQNIELLAIEHSQATSSPIITISVGMSSCFPKAGLSPEGLLKQADRHLYDAKRAGRNRVEAGVQSLHRD